MTDKPAPTVMRGRVIQPDRVWDDGMVVVDGGRIRAVGPYRPGAGDLIFDATDAFLAPGLLDLHTHGIGGIDTMDARPDGLAQMAARRLRGGVTAFLASTITASPENLARAVERVAADMTSVPSCLGIHLEGPYLNPTHAGAQPPEWLRDPTTAGSGEMADLVARSGPAIRMVTLAPERPGGLSLAQWLRSRRIVPAIGHTGADPALVQAALGAGVRVATHLYNGMPPIRSRDPGPVPALLQDGRVFLELIADGVHVDPSMVDFTISVAGTDRILLVTDSIRAAGLGDGAYDLGGHAVTVSGGVARTVSGSLAGSTLALMDAVFHVAKWAAVPIAQAFTMASLNPARALGCDAERGSLAVGKWADVVAVTPAGEILRTWLRGEAV